MKNSTYINLLYFMCGILIPYKIGAMDTTSTSMPSTQLTINLYDDFSHAFHRPPSPSRGDSSWPNVQLVQDAILASIGINPDANPLDNIVPNLGTSTHIPEVTIFEESSVPAVIYENSMPHYSADTTDIGRHISHEVTIGEQYIPLVVQGEFRFSDLTHDNWRELDYQSYQYNNSQDNNLKQHTTRQRDIAHRANQIPMRERLVDLLSLSNNPKALSVQLQTTCGAISSEYFTKSIQNKYRNFLWTSSGHFKPIDSPERQAQAFKILYPTIKSHFETDRIGLLHFLKENINIPGAKRQYNIETEWSGYFADNVDSLTAIFENLNVFEHNISPQTTKESAFLQQLGTISSLVEQGKLAEAKDMLTESSKKIYNTNANDSTRNALIREHDCLCAQYTALTEKLFDKYKSDPYYQRCLGPLTRGTMQQSEAFKILDARHYAANSLAYRMGYDPKKLSEHDKNLIYKEIGSKTKDSYGREDLFARKDLLNEQELNSLKEKLECFETQQKNENAPSAKVQLNNESTAVAPHEETEPIEPPNQSAQQEVSITASPPPLEPKEPKEKEESQKKSHDAQIQKEGIKESNIYKNAIESIEKNVNRFEKLGINQLSKKVLRHIINHHYKIGEVAKRRDQTSMFKDDINLVDLILETLEYGTEIEPGVKTYDCGKIIGHSLNGEPTTVIAVFLNSAKNMITTVFPR